MGQLTAFYLWASASQTVCELGISHPKFVAFISLFKAHTNPGGINVVVVFTDTVSPPDDLRDFCLGLFREGELFSLYSDWEVLLQRSYIFEDEHPGSMRHTHPVNKLVARKPPTKPDADDV